MKKLKSKVLKKTFCKICVITYIKEIFDSKITIFKSKCKELVQKLSVSYNKQINHLQNELKPKEKVIDQLLKSLSSLTNSELEPKNNIIQLITRSN